MESYLDRSLAKLEEFEGAIPWMYRDTVGKVTVGVGLMLPGAEAACRLPFRVGGAAATEAEIAAEFARVDALPMGRAALFYRSNDKPELARADMDSLLRTVLTGFENRLREALPQYDALPDGVKMALLDMIYNLGPAGLLQGLSEDARGSAGRRLGACGGLLRAARAGCGKERLDAPDAACERGRQREGTGGKRLEAVRVRGAGCGRHGRALGATQAGRQRG